MSSWFHSSILATSLAATVAVGIASAAIYSKTGAEAAPKADRLPLVAEAGLASPDRYVTIETRADGVSILSRVPVDVN